MFVSAVLFRPHYTPHRIEREWKAGGRRAGRLVYKPIIYVLRERDVNTIHINIQGQVITEAVKRLHPYT